MKHKIIGLSLWWIFTIMFCIFWLVNLGEINWMPATIGMLGGSITATVLEIMF
jgi:hypothetical protein